MSIQQAAQNISADVGENESSISSADPDPGNSSADPDLEDADELGSSEPSSIAGRLRQPLEGSIHEDRIGELWNPEEGGANRLVLVAEEVLGAADGLPRIVHIGLGIGEWYTTHADQLTTSDVEDDQEETSEDLDADTKRVLEYEG